MYHELPSLNAYNYKCLLLGHRWAYREKFWGRCYVSLIKDEKNQKWIFKITECLKLKTNFFKEKSENLFKLGKIALDKKKQKELEIEIIKEEEEDGLEALLKNALENKKKGFTRENPVTYSQKAKALELDQNKDKDQSNTNQTNLKKKEDIADRSKINQTNFF